MKNPSKISENSTFNEGDVIDLNPYFAYKKALNSILGLKGIHVPKAIREKIVAAGEKAGLTKLKIEDDISEMLKINKKKYLEIAQKNIAAQTIREMRRSHLNIVE